MIDDDYAKAHDKVHKKLIQSLDQDMNVTSLDDVKNYCILRNNNIDADAFIDFYESKNFMIGKNKMKDWKAAVRTWERRETKKQTMSKLDSQISAWQEAKKLL